MKSIVQFMGRRRSATQNLIDHAVAVDATYNQAGRMQAHISLGNITGVRSLCGTAWAVIACGPSATPVMLKKVQVCNDGGSDITLRLGIMTVNNGTPSTSNALLAWDTTVLDGDRWTWEGEIPLVGRYFYARSSANFLKIYVEYQEITPA